MEPIAVNHITVTRDLFAESHNATFSQRRQKMLLYCGFVFLAFGLVFLAIQVRFPMLSSLCVPALLTGALVILWAVTLQRSEQRRKYKAFQRVNGEISERTVTCWCTSLSVDTGKGEPTQIDYTDIREHKETEHLLLLICNDHRGIMLSKDGFDTGSWETLLSAIEKARMEAAEASRLLEM